MALDKMDHDAIPLFLVSPSQKHGSIESIDANSGFDKSRQFGVGHCGHGDMYKMKSFYGNIGSTDVYNILADMEKISKEKPDFDKLNALYKNYIDLYSIIIVEFGKYLSQ